MSAIDEVKDRLDIVELIGETVKLKKSGKNYTGFCPFHSNTRTPAFVVFPETGTWRCFGACNEGGDLFRFVMKKEGWDFPESLRQLAERAGVELKPRTPAQEEADQEQAHLRELLETAVTFYRHQLLNTEEGLGVLEYLGNRGLADSTLEQFGIGYAPKSWDATLAHLEEKGYRKEDSLKAGMASERETGGHFDRFRHRIMIPIRDARGRMAGFGARIVDPGDVPKFLNSPQTGLFDKGRLLYGLASARKAIRASDQAVIVEGYMDVIGLHQAGFENAVSPMGTALTEAQLRILKRFSRNIVLALDPDAAGDQATLRGLSLAREALDREMDPVFDARGLVRHEGRLDAEIRVVALPEGKDPDEVVVENRKAWPDLLSQAAPVVQYVLGVLSKGRDLEDPKIKADIARQILPLIEDVADPIEREAHRQGLARTLHIDERVLLDWRPDRGRRGRRTRRAGVRKEAVESLFERPQGAPIERFCLGVLLRYPDLVYQIDRQLHSMEMEGVSTQDFTGTEAQVIFHAVRAAMSQVDEDPQHRWRSMLGEDLRFQAEEFLDEVVEFDLDQPKVREEVLANFLRLRKRRLESQLTQLQFQMQAIQGTDQVVDVEDRVDPNILAQEVQAIASHREKLNNALAGKGGLRRQSMLMDDR